MSAQASPEELIGDGEGVLEWQIINPLEALVFGTLDVEDKRTGTTLLSDCDTTNPAELKCPWQAEDVGIEFATLGLIMVVKDSRDTPLFETTISVVASPQTVAQWQNGNLEINPESSSVYVFGLDAAKSLVSATGIEGEYSNENGFLLGTVFNESGSPAHGVTIETLSLPGTPNTTTYYPYYREEEQTWAYGDATDGADGFFLITQDDASMYTREVHATQHAANASASIFMPIIPEAIMVTELDLNGADNNSTQSCNRSDANLCDPELITRLPLNDAVTSVQASVEESGDLKSVAIDASAGGISVYPRQPWVYFNLSRGEIVYISDYDALASTDWDIALRRYVIRLNCGVSGPGCAALASVAGQTFDGLSEVPANLKWQTDTYIENWPSSCGSLETDIYGFGQPNAPMINAAWEFDQTLCSCSVCPTNTPMIINTALGAKAKLEVAGYYPGQDSNINSCSGSSANITLRWQMLD